MLYPIVAHLFLKTHPNFPSKILQNFEILTQKKIAPVWVIFWMIFTHKLRCVFSRFWENNVIFWVILGGKLRCVFSRFRNIITRLAALAVFRALRDPTEEHQLWVLGSFMDSLELKIRPKVGLLRPKRMPKYFLNNSQKSLKKSRKRLFPPQHGQKWPLKSVKSGSN